MGSLVIRLIRNSRNLPCKRCTGIHDYITRLSDDAPCDTPVAFSEPIAKLNARLHARGDRDVVPIPDELTTLVVMDESARQLPRTGSNTIRLAQFETVVRSA